MDKYIIALKEMGIKDADILEILKNCSMEDIVCALNQEEEKILSNMSLANCMTFFEDKELVKQGIDKASFILEENEKNKIKTTIYGSETYPIQLLDIPNPPVIIYYKGHNLVSNCKVSIACVGSRRPTKFSLNAINYLIPQWVNEGISIISGLALGVDRLSHIACLANGGITVAVLAHGLDSVQPNKNKKLAEQVLDNGGTLVSEYPVGTKPENYRFVNRNRIIVGLARSTVVFECAKNSGTMHSVDFAQKQQKPIFCPYPGEVATEGQAGLAYLLEKKIAKVIPNGVSYQIPFESMHIENTCHPMKVQEILHSYLKALIWNLKMEYSDKEILLLLKREYGARLKKIQNPCNVGEIIDIIIEDNLISTRECVEYLSSILEKQL